MNVTELPELATAFSSASNGMLAAILDQSMDCIKVIGRDGTVDYMNRNGQCAMEVDDFCAVAGQHWTQLWPEESRDTIEQAMASAKAGIPARFEAFCPTAKGTPRWWDVSVSPLRQLDGTIEGFIATSRDVTDRHNQSALQGAVADEMRHRLRNSYVVVGSLLSAYSRGVSDREAFAHEMIGRLSSLSVAQTMKADGRTEIGLADLISSLVSPYATPDCPIAIDSLPAATLNQHQVDALALVLGELACNSTKHGALSTTGTVNVAGRRADGVLELRWSERSARTVGNHSREGGQGLRLMRRVLNSQKGGIALEWGPHGLDAMVTMSVN